MRRVGVWLGVSVLIIGCRDASGPASQPALNLSRGQEDSTSAHGLNQHLLTRDASAIRLPRAPTQRDGRPWTGRRYIVGFHGAGVESRGSDQAVLRAAGALERYYFYGFRATAVYLDDVSLSRLRLDPAVSWIDSSDGILVPFTETTGWSFSQHGFGSAHAAGHLGNGDVRVAIIGNGVQCSLSDLYCGTGVDITGEPNEDGGSSHETAIASIIGAAVANDTGIKGGSPYVSLHSIRAGEPGIACADMAEALDIAAAYNGVNADIINLSYGWETNPCGGAVDSALAFAVWGEGVIVVAAAGNYGSETVAYPASSQLTVAVSALRQSPYGIASFSSYGSAIDIAAGGDDVAALDRTGAVVSVDGTSFATPHIVAALALLYAQKIGARGCKPSREEALATLYENTDSPVPFDPDYYGSGALNVYAALTSDWMQYECLEW